MAIRNVQVEVGRPLPRPVEEVAPAPTGPLATYVARPPRPVPMTVRLDKGGAITLTAGGREFTVATRMSLPDARWWETPPPEGGTRCV